MRGATIAVTVLLVALAGCGSAPTGTPTPTGTATDSTDAATATATATPTPSSPETAAEDAPATRTATAAEPPTTERRVTESAAPGDETDTSTPTATATATSAPTVTPTQTPTATRTPTRTPTPPSTVRPTSTPTATPTRTPTSDDAAGSARTVTVTRVIDGDTLEVRFPDGHTEDVRLLGVDTPEVHVANDPAEFEGIPETQAGHDWLRDWGHKASEFARTRLAGERIRIATDPAADRRGSYGRLLVYAYPDAAADRSFNWALLEQGYARLYESRFSKRQAFASAEATARRSDAGLWGYAASGSEPASTPTPAVAPDGGSAAGAGLSVAEVHADAAGNDHDNLNGEYVVLRNAGDDRLDLSGWRIADAAGHAHTFSSVALAPGESVTLYTGSGTDSASAVYWGSDAAVWNNGGDTITVTTDAGEVALRYEY